MGCPAGERLQQLLTGPPEGPAGAELEAHVEHCADCQAALDRMAAAATPSSWRLLLREPHLEEEPDHAFLDQLKHAAPESTPRSPWPGAACGDPPRVRGQAGRLPSVPGYEVLGILGDGGMGVVYRARQLRLNRLVALKMISAAGSAREEDLARFQREAEAAARLQHPNIVQIFEVGEYDGQPFFSMELVDGGNLAQQLQGLPQPPRAAAELIEALARAMHYAHGQGVIHRDLKPANVLLVQGGGWRVKGGLVSGERSEALPTLVPPATHNAHRTAPHPPPSTLHQLPTPKIADFGLAKRVDDVHQTQRGVVVGTLSYMAPEQASGRGQPVTPAADVYALGAILYELLTGRPPLCGDSWSDTLQQVQRDDPVPPGRLQPRVPRDVETICLKCLQKKPERRYGSAAELADDLRCYLDGEPIRARPTAPWEHVWKWARRRPAVASLSGMVVLALVLGVPLVTWQWRQAVANESAAVAARREVERLLAGATLDRAILLCERNDIAHGLLWLARGLESAVEVGDADLERVARANLSAWRQLHVRLMANLPQAGGCTAVAFSPDDRFAFTCHGDRKVQRWSVPSGHPAGPPLEHDFPVHDFALSADGRLLAAGGGSGDDSPGQVRFWDAATGRPSGAVRVADGAVRSVAFSSDGRRLLVRSRRSVEVWHVPVTDADEPAAPLRLAHPGGAVATAFSPNGKWVATGGADGTCRLRDAQTGSPRHAPLVHVGPVESVVFSPDGERLATTFVRLDDAKVHAVVGGGAQLWDVGTGQAIGQPLPHPGQVLALAFSPNSRSLFTAGAAPPDTEHSAFPTGTARLWDATTALPLGPSVQHTRALSAAAFHPDGRSVVIGGQDGLILFLEAATGQPIAPSFMGAGDVRALRYSPYGRHMISESADGLIVSLWQAPSSRVDGPPLRQSGRVFSAALSPDGTKLVAGADDGAARIWDVATREPVGEVIPHQSPVHAVCITPDGRLVLTGGGSDPIRTWDADTGRPAGPALAQPFSVRCAALSPDGALLVLGGQTTSEPLTGAVQCWNRVTAKPVGPVLPQPGCAHCVAFHPNGRVFLSGGDDGVRVFEAATGKLLRSYAMGNPVVHGLAVAPNGLTFGAAVADNRAQLWQFATERPAGPFYPHLRNVGAVAFSRDGGTVLTGSWDRTARLWDVATGKPLGPPMPHADRVLTVAFGPIHRDVVTGGADRQVLFWEVPAALQGTPDRVRHAVEQWTRLRLTRDGTVAGLEAGDEPTESPGSP